VRPDDEPWPFPSPPVAEGEASLPAAHHRFGDSRASEDRIV